MSVEKDRASTAHDSETPAPDKIDFGATQVTHTGKSTAASQISAEQWIGRTLGKYTITQVLGQGGMGLVLKAHDALIDRDVAIKVLSQELASDQASLKRFLTEARAAGKLNNPHVIGIYDVGQEGDLYYLVMELLPGGSVSTHLEEGKPYSILEATRIMIDACKGLAAAHGVGLIHRDIKPANLLFAADGTVKVTDFGVVKEIQGDRQQTLAGVVLGTPYFMSPEQCEARPVDARSDIYSLGASYYTLLTGNHPYGQSTSVMQVMYSHCHSAPPDPRATHPQIPAACASIIARAMAKSPNDRYQTVQEMLADLQVVAATLSGQTIIELPSGVKTAPPGAITVAAPRPQSRRSWLIAVGALVAAGAGFAGLSWWSGNFRQGNQNAAVAPVPADGIVPAPLDSEPIKVGVLHSLSGTMAASETVVVDATLLAIDEINQAGGVLGRKIKPVVVDGRSDWPTFAREAKRLIEEEQVVTVFGGWTSASRKTMKPVFEELDHLLIYPLQYEGLETSPNVVYMGAAPNQQIIPAVKWAVETLGKKRFFLVGSDYVFPRSAHEIIKDYLKEADAEVVGEAFLPLGTQMVEGVILQIQDAQPEMILNTINGDTNIAFFRDLRAAGITPESLPTMSFSIGEQELRNFDLDAMQGDYAAWTYFQSIESPANQEFVQRFQERYPQRVITDPMECAYTGVKLWAQAVNEAGSVEPKAIQRSLLTQRMVAPGGPIRIDPDTQHCFKIPRIGRIAGDGQFEIVWGSAEPIAPDPFPESRTAAEWKIFLHDLYTSWDNRWSAPGR